MSDRQAQLMKMLEADPSDADIPYMLAQECIRSGAEEDAVTWFDRCLAIDSHYHYAYYHKAKALEALDRTDDALLVLREGLAISQADHAAQAIGEIGAYIDELT